MRAPLDARACAAASRSCPRRRASRGAGGVRLGVGAVAAQEQRVQARRGDGQGVDPRGVQPADRRVEVVGVDR